MPYENDMRCPIKRDMWCSEFDHDVSSIRLIVSRGNVSCLGYEVSLDNGRFILI